MRLYELCPQDMDRFLLNHAHDRTPKATQLMVSAMRSFLRFLFRYGETKRDLSTAVPTVPAWRLSDVPKYIKPEEVESLLESCDRSSSVGRRNYAILLLIARLGLRAGEVVSLELGDINWRTSESTIRGKGQFCDRLPLPQSVGEALADLSEKDRPEVFNTKGFLTSKSTLPGLQRFNDSKHNRSPNCWREVVLSLQARVLICYVILLLPACYVMGLRWLRSENFCGIGPRTAQKFMRKSI